MGADACEALCGTAIIEFIRERCNSASLASVAERFCCHPNSVSRILKRELGVSFQEVLVAARMERAAELLKGSGMSVAQVAMACGYESMTHFYQAFKRMFGVTPAQFRAKGRLGQAA